MQIPSLENVWKGKTWGIPLSPAFSARSRLVREGTLRVQLAGLGFVERQGIGREEFVEETIGLRQMQATHRFPEAFLRLEEICIPHAPLLQAFDERRELVRRLYDLRDRRVGFKQQRPVALLQLRRQKRQQLFAADSLDLLVGILDLGVIILDRRRQIAGQDFRCVVEQRRRRAAIR